MFKILIMLILLISNIVIANENGLKLLAGKYIFTTPDDALIVRISIQENGNVKIKE